jgi:hypothetical protein
VLTDFFDISALSEAICNALAEPGAFTRHRQAAFRRSKGNMLDHCLSEKITVIGKICSIRNTEYNTTAQ